VARAEAYLRAKFHLDPSNRLAAIHQRHRQTDRQTGQTGQTDRQRSDSIGRTVYKRSPKNETLKLATISKTPTYILDAVDSWETLVMFVRYLPEISVLIKHAKDPLVTAVRTGQHCRSSVSAARVCLRLQRIQSPF